MNSRSGIFGFFLFLFLLAIVLLQVLSMVQSDRLYERINRLSDAIETLSRSGGAGSTQPTTKAETQVAAKSTGLSEYPGDQGDWLIWALEAEPASLNIITSTDMGTQWIVGGNIFETLTEYNMDTMEIQPVLAKSFQASEDGLELRFRLRDDVCFSDGRPITTDDIIFTFETIKNPKIDAASLANYFNDFEKVNKIDDHEFTVSLKRKYYKALSIFGEMPIYPKHIYEFKNPDEFNKHISNPIGSGPYVIEKWDVGRQVVLKRNEQYWRRKPKLDKIVYQFILNETSALQSLRAGQVDFVRPLPEQYADLSSNPEFSSKFQCLSYWNPGAGYFYIGWNEDTPFFKDRRVRQAMTLIVDREMICKKLLKGEARVPTGPFYVYSPQNDATIKPWPYDPEQAKKLLDEAEWVDTDGDGIRDKDGVAFRFHYMIVGGSSLHEQIVKLVKDSASKVGIDVIPDPYEWSIFTERLHNRQFEATNLAWQGVVEEDPYQIWHSSQIGDKGSNYIGFRNSETDKIIEEARMTFDRDKRNQMYHRFHAILHEEQPYTFVYTRPSQRFLDPRFKNVIIHKLGLDPLEWYVPKGQQRYR